jgi:hypothetical protein
VRKRGRDTLPDVSASKPRPTEEAHGHDYHEIFYKNWGWGVSAGANRFVFSHRWPLWGDDWDTQMLFFLQHGVMAPWATWRAASSALRIRKVADLLELLQRPRRGGCQPKGEPAPDDGRRHIAHGSCGRIEVTCSGWLLDER